MSPMKSDNHNERLARAEQQPAGLLNRERIVQTVERARRTAKALLHETQGVPRKKR